MGWSTDLFANIEFHKKTYNDKYEVESDLEESKDLIARAKKELTTLAFMTEPSKFCDKDESPECYIDDKLNSWLEILEEEIINSYKLNLLLSNWDACHNKEGLAIEPPENIEWDSAFLSGDFVFSNVRPTQPTLFGSVIDNKGNVVDDSESIIDDKGNFKKL